MCLAQPKTQLFEKSWVLGLGKKRVQNTIFMDRRRSINQNAHVRLNYYRWANGELRKDP